MQTLVEFIVKNIVNNSDNVFVREDIIELNESGRSSKIYYVSVNPEDIGVVIGKNGHTIRSIRNIVKVKAVKDGIYADVRIEEG